MGTVVILIWGFKVRYKSVDSGQFFCPKESVDRPYSLRQARRWFTFLFVPVIPLKRLGEFVECESCSSSYEQRVLTTPTTAQVMDNLANAMRHAVIAIIKADGTINHELRGAGLAIMQKYADAPYSEQHLDHDLVGLSSEALPKQLEQVAGSLNDFGKENLLTACVTLASSDGSITASELSEIERAGRALGMSSAHVRGVLIMATDGSQAH